MDTSFTAPSDSSAFFTPAASLAVAGLEAAGLQPAQLQVGTRSRRGNQLCRWLPMTTACLGVLRLEAAGLQPAQL